MKQLPFNGSSPFEGGKSPDSVPSKLALPRQRLPDFVLSREDHRLREMCLDRSGKHGPRRSQTDQNYQLLNDMLPEAFSRPAALVKKTIESLPPTLGEADATIPASLAQTSQATPGINPDRAVRGRPVLGPTRRSYSVMDCEPPPRHHLLSLRLQLLDLSSDLHYAIFDFLDPIDSTCLGLTNKHFYAIHRRLHGTVPLPARRDGPNELEWAWHLAGAVTRTTPSDLPPNHIKESLGYARNALASLKDLSQLRVRGQAYCRKCGVTRCELHKHIEGWMGTGLEYCSVNQKFGPIAPHDAKPYCYMRKPDDPHRCGRHRFHRSRVQLQ